jgi:hypothetical protein
MSAGWIKLHRKIRESACYSDPNPWVTRVWLECLLTATHVESKVWRNGREITLAPGQFLYSRTAWAERLGIAPGTLRNVIAKLQKWDMVEDKGKDKGLATVYQVKNWEEYQNEDKVPARKRTKTGQSEDIYKNDKNGEKEEEKKLTPLAMRPEVREAWELWAAEVGPITRNEIFHRNALSGLLNKYGTAQVMQMIRLSGQAHRTDKIPFRLKPANPKQLEERWDEIYAWGKGKFSQSTQVIQGKR